MAKTLEASLRKLTEAVPLDALTHYAADHIEALAANIAQIASKGDTVQVAAALNRIAVDVNHLQSQASIERNRKLAVLRPTWSGVQLAKAVGMDRAYLLRAIARPRTRTSFGKPTLRANPAEVRYITFTPSAATTRATKVHILHGEADGRVWALCGWHGYADAVQRWPGTPVDDEVCVRCQRVAAGTIFSGGAVPAEGDEPVSPDTARDA